MTRHLFNHEAFALFVHMRTENPKHLSMTEAAEEAGVSKAQLFRAIHKQPIAAGAVLSLCIWMEINPFAFLLDAGTGRGLAPLPTAPVSRDQSTETRGDAHVPAKRAA